MAKRYYYKSRDDGRIFNTNGNWTPHNSEPMSQAAGREALAQQSAQELARFFQKGSTVYCVIRSVSRSGMSRKMAFFGFDSKAEPGRDPMRPLTGLMNDVLQWGTDDNLDLKVGGCGMDMVFHTIYETVGKLQRLGVLPAGFNGSDVEYVTL